MHKYKVLFIIVLIFLLIRLALLFTAIDTLYNFEDRAIGMMAKAIMAGPRLPLFEYSYNLYEGGSFILGFITIPFFFLFGPNYFSLKLTSLLISTLTLIVFFLFVWKFFNRRVALITAMLYLFSSITWIYSNLATNCHLLCLFFSLLAIYIFYEIIFNHKSKSIHYLSLGIISGLGIYVSDGFLMSLAAIFLVWFIHDKRLFIKKELYIFFMGLFIGMIPWFYYNLVYQFQGAYIFRPFFKEATHLGVATWLNIILRFLSNIWFTKILEIRVLGNRSLGLVYATIYILIYWASFLYILWHNRHSSKKFILSKYFFILLFPIFIITVATLYGVNVRKKIFVDARYLLGLYPFVFLTIAIAMDRLFLKLPLIKSIIIKLFSLLLILISLGYLERIDFRDFGKGFKEPGYSYILLSFTIMTKHARDPYRMLDYMTRLAAPEKYEVIYLPLNIPLLNIPLADNIQPIKPAEVKEYLKLSYRLGERYRPCFYKILIKGPYCSSYLPLEDLLREVKILAEQVDDKYKPYLYEAVGNILVYRYADDPAKYKEFGRLIEKPYLAYYYRGLTEFFDAPASMDLLPYINRFKNCMQWLDERYKPFYLGGIGETLAKLGFGLILIKMPDDSESINTLRGFFQDLEPRYKRYGLEGLGKSLSYFYSPNNKMEVDKLINIFNAEDRRVISTTLINNLEGYN